MYVCLAVKKMTWKGKKWHMRFFGVMGSERECSLDMVESITTLTLLENLALIDFFPYIYRCVHCFLLAQ
jgi:hypothetical protein